MDRFRRQRQPPSRQTLYAGTWCSKRRLRTSRPVPVKLGKTIAVVEHPEGNYGRDGEYDYTWTHAAAVAGAIACHCRCTFCGIDSHRALLGVELMAYPDHLVVARLRLRAVWRSCGRSRYAEVLSRLGVAPMCWECILRRFLRQGLDKQLVAPLPAQISTPDAFFAALFSSSQQASAASMPEFRTLCQRAGEEMRSRYCSWPSSSGLLLC